MYHFTINRLPHRRHLLLICAIILIFFAACNDNSLTNTRASNTLFTKVDSTWSNITFKNVLKESKTRFYYNFNTVYDGGGVSLGDINNDGLVDIYFTGNEVPNRLYLNKGDFQFEDITDKAGVTTGKAGWVNGSTMVDINGDGWLDIYVCRGGWIQDANHRTNKLFINNGDLTFTEMAGKYGLADRGFSFQSVFFDYDNDNDLDMYLINHPSKTGINVPEYLDGRVNGSKHSKDRLYQNNGNNTFADITDRAKMDHNFGFGLSATVADLDGNGFADVYVANDYTENDYLWMNNGNGTFTNKVKELTGHVPLFSMGCDIADFNNDGYEDILNMEMLPEDYKRSKTLMADMNTKQFEYLLEQGFHHQHMHNTLQLNQGNGHFSEIAQMAGLSKTDWSWACYMSDLDNDGLRDIFVSNGYKEDIFDKDSDAERRQYVEGNNMDIPDMQEFLDLTTSTKSVNYVFKNNGDLTFTKMTKEWGMDYPSFSNGAALSDLDNDGDLDVVINNYDEPAFVFRNNAESLDHHYLRVKLKGPTKNPHGLGAKITLTMGEEILFEEVKMSRGYLSSVEPISHFGLGKNTQINELKIRWPDGKVSVVNQPAIDQVLKVEYEGATSQSAEKTIAQTIFKNQTGRLQTPFVHKENKFDDYKKQILLPHRLSRLGPFVSVADVNGDDLEDFYVGGAYIQAGQLYIQKKDGTFKNKTIDAFEKDRSFEDMGSLFFDIDGDGDLDLYVTSGGSEFPVNSPFYQDRLYVNDGKGNFTKSNNLPPISSSTYCLAANDFDEDGDLDLYVGARLIPDKYPYAPKSYLLKNEQGKFTDVVASVAPDLENAGMISTALWIDLNGDNKSELVVAGEWTPIRVFAKEGEQFVEMTGAYQLNDLTGWWNRIVPMDIDQDGDVDLIAGNLGHNYKFKATNSKPFHVYCSDFDDNGSYDIVLAKYNGADKVPVRGRQCSSEQMPFIAEKFPTYNAFADAKLEDILGEKMEDALHYQANIFSSVLLQNQGDHFDVQKLPAEAQFSTLNAIVSDDFNQDGAEEILIGGNFFNTEAETTRADASVGAMIKNDTKGQLRSVNSLKSGFFIPYDVKDMKKILIGSDKAGVIVASNNDSLRLFTYPIK